MADFDQAHKFVERREGFYSNDPADPGGETLYGIARTRHPNWGGWETWDQNRVKREQDLPEDARRALHAWRDANNIDHDLTPAQLAPWALPSSRGSSRHTSRRARSRIRSTPQPARQRFLRSTGRHDQRS